MARVSIEDCLKYVENRFALVAIASDRARKLMGGASPLLKVKNKEIVTALREIAEDLVVGSDVKEVNDSEEKFETKEVSNEVTEELSETGYSVEESQDQDSAEQDDSDEESSDDKGSEE